MSEQSAPDVPDFDLIRAVGSGGFGQVWLATNRTTGFLRAVKLIPLDCPRKGTVPFFEAKNWDSPHAKHWDSPQSPAAREISSLTRLEANLRCRHPNLLAIHHVGKTARHLFYVMDPADDVRGGPASTNPDYQPATLENWLRGEGRSQKGAQKGDSPIFRSEKSGQSPREKLGQSPAKIGRVPMPPEVCMDYARQLLGALASLHEAGMVHRDVKPANCLFVGGQLKLADFGLVTESHPLVSRLGTQKYMPPDGRMDMRADVYAVGLVIYEMITGLPVDDFPRLGGQSRQIRTSPILTTLLRLVLRACEREPEKRFADARAMLAEVEGQKGTVPFFEAKNWDSPREKLGQSPTGPSLGRRLATCGGAALVGVCLLLWASFPRRVDVSFVTHPYEARIYLDGVLLKDSTGAAYTTPCTVADLSARIHRVAFQSDGAARWEAGAYDFAQQHQIVARPPHSLGKDQ